MNRQQRRAMANGKAAPIPAGGVDLSHAKGGDKAAQQEHAQAGLRQQGFLCSCGERMESDAVMVMGYNLGQFPQQVATPRGPGLVLQDGAQFFTAAYHSRQCADYLDALKNGIPTQDGVARPSVRAVRALPATEWLDAPDIEAE